MFVIVNELDLILSEEFNTKEEAEIERIYLQPDFDDILRVEKI